MKRSFDKSFTEYRTDKCEWHYEIQNCIKKIEELVNNHEVRKLSEEATKASQEWNLKFQAGKRKHKSIWQKIQNFYCKPSIFRMREFQIYLENDIKANDPYISKHDMNDKVKRLIISIENEIGEELRQKFPEISEEDISKRVKNISVKGNDMNKEQWLVSYIVIFTFYKSATCLSTAKSPKK